MTDISAAVGLAQIKKLDYIIEEKRKRAALYNEIIRAKLPELIPPVEPEGWFHTYQSYVCMLDSERLGKKDIAEGGALRNELLQLLEDQGIATRQGTHAVHMLGYYRKRFGYKPEDFVNAYACDHLSITLPLYIGITDEDQEYVIDTMKKTLKDLVH